MKTATEPARPTYSHRLTNAFCHVGWARFCAHQDSQTSRIDYLARRFWEHQIRDENDFARPVDTFISTRLNTGMYNVQLPAWAQRAHPTLTIAARLYIWLADSDEFGLWIEVLNVV